jgi:hypothetical protein
MKHPKSKMNFVDYFTVDLKATTEFLWTNDPNTICAIGFVITLGIKFNSFDIFIKVLDYSP